MPTKLSKKAKAAYKAGEYKKAAELFNDAANGFSLTGDKFMVAEMLNNQSVALLQNKDPESALRVILETDRVFAEAGDTRREAMTYGNQGAAYEALGKFEEALVKYQKAADLLKETDDKELRAYVLQSLSTLQLKTGNQLQSLATMQAALESKKKLSLKDRLLKKLLKIPFKMAR